MRNYLKGKIAIILSKLNLKIAKKSRYELSFYHKRNSNDKAKNLNIGAGKFYHPYWTNVDFYSDWYRKLKIKVDLHYDILKHIPIPINDEKINLIYCSHTIEHIDDKSALYLFNECYRLLKPGGGFRLTMPDIDLHFNALNRNDILYFSRNPKYSIEQYFLFELASQISEIETRLDNEKVNDQKCRTIFHELPFEQALDWFINKCSIEIQKTFVGHHINWWNFNKTKRMLEDVGFTKVNLSGYGQSNFFEMRNTTLFDSTHPQYSLYVEAIK